MKQIAEFMSDRQTQKTESTLPSQTLPALPVPIKTPAIEAAEARLLAASDDAWAVCMAKLVAMYGPPAGWKHSEGDYRLIWGQLPADVLYDAIIAYMATPTSWPQKFPLPGQLLFYAQDEMARRRKHLDHAREEARAMLPAPVERRITAEEVDAVMAKYRGKPGWEFLTAPKLAARRSAIMSSRYVLDEVPETIAGKPWRETD